MVDLPALSVYDQAIKAVVLMWLRIFQKNWTCRLQNLGSERSASVEGIKHSEIIFLYFIDIVF